MFVQKLSDVQSSKPLSSQILFISDHEPASSRAPGT